LKLHGKEQPVFYSKHLLLCHIGLEQHGGVIFIQGQSKFLIQSLMKHMGELKHVYCCTMSIVFSSDGPVTALPNPFKASVGLLSSC